MSCRKVSNRETSARTEQSDVRLCRHSYDFHATTVIGAPRVFPQYDGTAGFWLPANRGTTAEFIEARSALCSLRHSTRSFSLSSLSLSLHSTLFSEPCTVALHTEVLQVTPHSPLNRSLEVTQHSPHSSRSQSSFSYLDLEIHKNTNSF